MVYVFHHVLFIPSLHKQAKFVCLWLFVYWSLVYISATVYVCVTVGFILLVVAVVLDSYY